MINKKLSVVIPTLNRLELLKITLAHLIPQIERNLEQVDFQISINDSNDNTEGYIKSLSINKPFIKYKNFDTRVAISDSFSRSIEMCSGEYIIIFGDDDIPSPYFIENILAVLNKNPDISFIHFNRIVGSNSSNHTMNKLRLEECQYTSPLIKYSLPEFIKEFSISPGFISCMVFKKEAWGLGIAINNSNHFGYEFLSRIYAGLHKLDTASCIYLNYPILMQRLIKKREWNDLWPKYWLIGVPNLLETLDDEGITENVLETWYSKLDKSTIKFMYYLLWAASYKRSYKPLISEINKNQRTVFRKLSTVVIINFAPRFLFSFIRKNLYK